jgi:MFS family permease
MGIAVGAILLLDVIMATVLQRLVPDEERGRAMGVIQIPGGLASIAGAFTAPLIADRLGVASALGIVAVATIVLGLTAVAILRPTGVLLGSGLDPRRLELLRSSVFGGVLPIRIEAAARRLQLDDVVSGQRVIEQGDVADRVYLIDTGSFTVSQRTADGGTVDLRTMGPGEVFGEIGVLSAVPRTATVTATSAGRLFSLDRDGFLGLVDAGPGLTTQLLDRYRGTWDRS